MKKIIPIFVVLIMLFLVTGCKDKTVKYTVIFENEDGSVYEQMEIKEGETVTVADLTKEGHTFDGWYLGEDKITLPFVVTQNLTLKPKFNVNTYSYKFISEGKVISEGTGLYGSTIPYPSEPTKESTVEFEYKFKEWDKTDTILSGDITFTAVFEQTNVEYTYEFVVDGKVIFEGTGIYGSAITYPSNPTKEENAEYKFEFMSWDKTDTVLTENIRFNAVFENIKKQYTYKFLDDTGKVLKQEKVDYGTMPVAPNNVSKDGYRFVRWDKEVVPVVKDIEYRAVFKKIETNPSLDGKKVSIIGDSISTFYAAGSEMNSYYNAENTYYYPIYSASIKSVDLTWWYKLIKNNKMQLGINNSWSGSCAYGSSANAGVSDGRINTIDNNGAPDIVIIYLGTNDCASGYTTEQFGSAIRQIINKVQKLCDADIFVTTLGYTAYTGSKYKESTRLSYNQEIRKIVNEYKCGLVPLDEYIVETSYSFYLGDNLHYNAKGADLLSKIYEKSIKEFYGIRYTGKIEVEHKEPLPEGVIGKITATTSDSDFWGKYETEVFFAPSSTFISAQYSYRMEITKQNNKYVVTAIHKSGVNASFNSDYVIVVSDAHVSNKAILADIANVKVGSIVEFSLYGGFPKEILFKAGDGGNNNNNNSTQTPSVEVEGKLAVGAYNEGVWTKYETTVIGYSYEAMDKTSTFVNFHIIGITKDGSDYKVTYLKNVDENFTAPQCDYYILIYRNLQSKTYFENAKLNQKVVISGDIKTPTCYLEFK